jgi:hypothetical protein
VLLVDVHHMSVAGFPCEGVAGPSKPWQSSVKEKFPLFCKGDIFSSKLQSK